MRNASDTLPLMAVGGLALAKLSLHLLTNGRYGYHRDELYYLASGAHPAAGYVDFPPITPLLARLNVALLPESPWTLRLFSALAGACMVLLVPILARDLGGRRVAQVLASLATATSLVLLGANWLVSKSAPLSRIRIATARLGTTTAGSLTTSCTVMGGTLDPFRRDPRVGEWIDRLEVHVGRARQSSHNASAQALSVGPRGDRGEPFDRTRRRTSLAGTMRLVGAVLTEYGGGQGGRARRAWGRLGSD